MQNTKTILLIAQNNKPEALRIASGLTLLDDQVKVDVDGELGTDEETCLQLEALEFVEVPVERLELSDTENFNRLAKDIISADVVFIV